MASDNELPALPGVFRARGHSLNTHLGAGASGLRGGDRGVPAGGGSVGTRTRLLSMAGFSPPQASVYCVAAVLWTAAKFGVPRDHKLALPRRLKTLLLEMARCSAQERPSVAEASKVTPASPQNSGPAQTLP